MKDKIFLDGELLTDQNKIDECKNILGSSEKPVFAFMCTRKSIFREEEPKKELTERQKLIKKLREVSPNYFYKKSE